MKVKEIKAKINEHLRAYARENKLEMPDVNRAAKKKTGKARPEMSMAELESFWGSINQSFPVENKDMDNVIEVNSPMPARKKKDETYAVYQCKKCKNFIYNGDSFQKLTTVQFCADCADNGVALETA